MKTWQLARRNVVRNKRRTVSTVLAIGLSCAGLLLFGGYVAWAHRASETHAVAMTGHLQLSKQGFRARGAGNPPAFAIDNYDEVRRLLSNDEVIGPRLDMVTGQLVLQGLVSFAEKETSTAFIGVGAWAEELERLARWNPYGLADVRALKANAHLFAAGSELDAAEPEGVTLGVGLARILDLEMPAAEGAAGWPWVELLSQSPDGGLPNMISAKVRKLSTRPLAVMDDRLMYMPIEQASELLFPGESPRVTSVILLLKETREMPVVEGRLAELSAQGLAGFEWCTYQDLVPNNVRSVRMMDMFFLFSFCIIAGVLVFTIYNTMMMSVMERLTEIGTVRAMGVTRRGIIRMFTAEGLLLGIAGTMLGLLLALLAAWVINQAEIVYIAPMVTMYTKLEVLVASAPGFAAGSLGGCLAVAVAGAYLPARRASRLQIVDALRT